LGYLAPFALLSKTPPGTCPECAVAHDPKLPHSLQSLTYQYKFYEKHGRWPTWKDAMEHCSVEIQSIWIAQLRKYGIGIDPQKKSPQKASRHKTTIKV